MYLKVELEAGLRMVKNSSSSQVHARNWLKAPGRVMLTDTASDGAVRASSKDNAIQEQC